MSGRDDLKRILTDPGAGLASTDPVVRRIAIAAARCDAGLVGRIAELLATDPDPTVRRECAEVLGRCGIGFHETLTTACADPVAEVREAAVTALGEIASPSSVELLMSLAVDSDEDKLVREAAVASLGAIGDERALPVLLDLVASAPPQIRRRCVPALSVFDGDEVERALRGAAADRNPMVREAAEMVVGRSST